jgi:hypothetical protein
MSTWAASGATGRAARALLLMHGDGSAAEAAHRADVHIANIDLGGFAFWKGVERSLRTR